MLAGWRGPYVLDALGNHDRAVLDIRHWIKRQNLTPVATADPAIGPWDDTPNFHLTRKEKMLHSNGDLSGNHYDMNMVFMDMMLRHLMWTGDLDFAREIWPAFQRHLAWEHRLFRRTYTTASGKTLPLYEAYAAIWASDNLQYNGGGAAHSSAYNIFAFRFAAALARALGEDPTPYETEAELILEGMQQLLWLPAQGAFAESKDLMQPQTVYSNPALWTVYHTIDSEVPTPRQAWQMAAERLAALRHVPIHGEGVPQREPLHALLLRLAALHVVAQPPAARRELPHGPRPLAGRNGGRGLSHLQGHVAGLHVHGPLPRRLPHDLRPRRPPPGVAARLRRSHRHHLPRSRRGPLRHPAQPHRQQHPHPPRLPQQLGSRDTPPQRLRLLMAALE